MKPYERLKAWQLCHALALELYRTTKRYPASERFGITSQTRRAAFSAAANMVEGSSKSGTREFRRFLDMSIGSLSELSYWLLVSRELGFLDETAWKELDAKRDEASRVTWGLYRAMGRRTLGRTLPA